MDAFNASSFIGIFCLAIAIWIPLRTRHLKYRLPPGPRGLPFIGTVRFPKELHWKVYRRWSQEYGSDIIHINTLGNDLIILNSYESAIELLDKRSSIDSDRPLGTFTMLTELCGLGWLFAFARYGQEWRDGRKAFQREFRPQAVEKYRPHERWEAVKLLRCLLNDPDNFMKHIDKMSGGLVLSIAYGIEVQEENDPFLAAAELSIQIVNTTLVPGTYLVDLIPLRKSLSIIPHDTTANPQPEVKHVPEWFPGAGFKKQARVWKESMTFILHKPWELVRARTTAGHDKTPDCAAKSLLEDMVMSAKDPLYMETVVREAVGSMYVQAGSDTTSAVLRSFVLSMVLNPDAQHRAQASIDEVCNSRLPDFSDYDSLPYVHAVVKEVLRWYPVASLNLAHRCTQDNIYQAYLIPEGSVVVANNWAMLHDPKRYTDPSAFKPERFLKPAGTDGTATDLDPDVFDPELIIFGFGRRVCPGRHMAYDSLWITIACIMAIFDIGKAMGEDGQPITPSEDCRLTFIVAPKPFLCKITPRTVAHEEMIRQAVERVPSFVDV